MFGCLFFHFDVGWHEMYANYMISLATARQLALSFFVLFFLVSWVSTRWATIKAPKSLELSIDWIAQQRYPSSMARSPTIHTYFTFVIRGISFENKLTNVVNRDEMTVASQVASIIDHDTLVESLCPAMTHLCSRNCQYCILCLEPRLRVDWCQF